MRRGFITNALVLVFLRPIISLPAFKKPSHISDNNDVYINTDQCVFQTDARFLSIAIDSATIRRKWKQFNFTSEKLQNLAHGLQPAYLRLGGTDEDFLIFAEEDFKPAMNSNNTVFKVQHGASSIMQKDYHDNLSSNKTNVKVRNHTKTAKIESTDYMNSTTTVVRGCHKVFNLTTKPEDFVQVKDTHSSKTPEVSNIFQASNAAKHNGVYTNFTMDSSEVDEIFNFANKTGLDIIFGLNVLLRTPEGVWDSSNAEKLMRYITKKQYHCGWELGNEPFDLKGLVNKTITGKQLANDFNKFRQLLNQHPDYGSLIVGPDVSSPWRGDERPSYLEAFLTNIDKGSINALTYHQYYTNNQASVEDFYNPAILDDLITSMRKVEEIMSKTGAAGIPPWLGETSSAYGGGVPNVSDSYIAGFMWLDKLGIAARLRHKVVIRQVFFGGNYALIDKETYHPFPDYWTSLLYNMLVGSKTLEVRNGLVLDRKIRVYAHCSSERSAYPRGAVVVLALNTLHEGMQLVFMDDLQGLPVDQYVLTPGEDNNLTSKTVKLNGKLLALVDDKFLPKLKPKRIVPPQKISLPPVSYGFFVIPNANAKACMNECFYRNDDISVKL